MDAFFIAICLLVALAIAGACTAAWCNRGIPLAEFGRRSQRQARGLEARLEQQDLEQMLAETNRRRRARGLPERSIADAIREFESD